MAIARTGHILGTISGPLGSVIFANTRAGLLLKHRPLKINRTTQRQLRARATFRATQLHWQQMSNRERAPWTAAAWFNPITNRLGVKSTLSPFHYFLHSQATTAFWDHPFWTVPPPPRRILKIKNISLTFTQGGPFNFTIEITPISLYAVIKAHRPFSSHATTSPNRWTTIGLYPFSQFDTFNIYPEFIKALGTPRANEALGISIIISQHLHYTSPWPPTNLTTTVLAP